VSPEAYTRRQVLVDRRFQLKYAVGLAIGGASLCAAFGGAVWLALHQARESLGPESQATLQGTETTVLVLSAFMALVMALVLSLVGLLVSHRVAGPMRVLRGQLRQLAEGRFPRWRPLRSHDELRDVFAEFHATVDTLRRREHEELAAVESVLATGGGGDARATLTSLAAGKRARLDGLDDG
jgi:methyl-accepting chemotaxis protein